jgi:hypothetical protein
VEVEAQDGGFEADLLLVVLYLCTVHSQTAYEGLYIAVVYYEAYPIALRKQNGLRAAFGLRRS